MFGVGDKNFVNNSGSYFIIQIGLIGYFLGRWFLNKVAVRFAEHPWARKVGMWAYEAKTWLQMKSTFKKLFVESYFDLLFCSFINMIALIEALDIDIYFKRRSDWICSAITIFYSAAVFMFPVYVAVVILKNFDKLDTKKVSEHHGIYYDECRTTSRVTALYNVIFMLRRLITTAVLIFLRDHAFFQC